MKPTVDHLRQRFDHFNQLAFGGELPVPTILLSRARTFVGQCAYTVHRGFLGRKTNHDFKLKFSVQAELGEAELDDVMVHEMIHYYIAYRNLKDTSAHGPLFRQMMEETNRRFGLHVSITHHPSPEQAASLRRRPREQHIVAVVDLGKGGKGFKVLTNGLRGIRHYYFSLACMKGVESITLYRSTAPYFDRFPHSTALRLHMPRTDEPYLHLADAERLEWDGERLVKV